MAMTTPNLSKEYFLKSIEFAIRAAIEEKIVEVTETAKKQIENALKEKLDSIALKLLKQYSVEMDGAQIVIRVMDQRQ